MAAKNKIVKKNFDNIFNIFKNEFSDISSKELKSFMSDSGYRIGTKGNILDSANKVIKHDDALEIFRGARQVGGESKKVVEGAAEQVVGESKKIVEGATEQVVEDLSRPISRSKGDKFYTESLNNQKLSETEIAKFRKEQELYNQTVGEGTKHSAESREFDFTDKRKLDQTISERGKDYNNTDNALQLQLNERMRKATGDGNYAQKKGKIVSQSAFNNTKAMDEYMTKNNIKNITNDEAIKINEVRDNLKSKHGDKLAETKAKETAAAKSQENKEKVGGFMNKAIPTAIGGGLIFSMFNSGGQMSNSELYGQQRPYGQ